MVFYLCRSQQYIYAVFALDPPIYNTIPSGRMSSKVRIRGTSSVPEILLSPYPFSPVALSHPLREIYKTILFRIFRVCRHFHFFFSVLRFTHTFQPARCGSAAFPPVTYTYHSSFVIMIKEFLWIILPLQPRLTLEI